MSPGHADIGPELRQLAQAILDRLDPAVRAAAARAGEAFGGPGRCQQTWCPLCALAALISGEQHPMLTVIADHSVTLLSALRAMVGDPDAPGPASGDAAPPRTGSGPPDPSANGSYESIPIVVEVGEGGVAEDGFHA